MESNITPITTNENQDKIVAWAVETFGTCEDVAMIASRAYEEAAEMLASFFSAPRNLLEEIADVFIVICQVAERFNVKLKLVEATKRGNRRGLAASVGNSVSIILGACVDENIHIVPHLRQFEQQISLLAFSIGDKQIQTLVNEKMAINRERDWSINSLGHAQHSDNGSQVLNDLFDEATRILDYIQSNTEQTLIPDGRVKNLDALVSGESYFDQKGVFRNPDGTRSIFDDVDEGPIQEIEASVAAEKGQPVDSDDPVPF